MEEKNFEARVYQEFTNRQLRVSKNVFLATFNVLGGVFLILGAVFAALKSYNSELFIAGIVFVCMGAGFLLLGLLIYAILPKTQTTDYEKFLKRIDKYGLISMYDVAAMLAIQQAKIELLEKEIEELKQK